MNQVHHDELVGAGLTSELVIKSLGSGLAKDAILALIKKYGLQLAMEILTTLMS